MLVTKRVRYYMISCPRQASILSSQEVNKPPFLRLMLFMDSLSEMVGAGSMKTANNNCAESFY